MEGIILVLKIQEITIRGDVDENNMLGTVTSNLKGVIQYNEVKNHNMVFILHLIVHVVLWHYECYLKFAGNNI